MENEQFVQQIRQLEDKSTYFGLILEVSTSQDCTLKEAWLEVEERRKSLGLMPKYTSYPSVMNARSRFHKTGEMVRIIDPNDNSHD